MEREQAQGEKEGEIVRRNEGREGEGEAKEITWYGGESEREERELKYKIRYI